MIIRNCGQALVAVLCLWSFSGVWAGDAAVPQTGLDLSAAKPLVFERLGQPVVTIRTSEYVFPKPEGKGWYAVVRYAASKEEGGGHRAPTFSQVYVVDLDTGQTTAVNVPQVQGLSNYLGALTCGVDGKYYVTHEGNDFGIWRFDPATGGLDWIAYPQIKERFTGYSIQASPDRKKLYIGTASRNSLLIEFDVTTQSFRNLGVQGPDKPAPVYVYSLAVDDEYVYMAVRKQPWYLVATNRRTGEQKVLLEAEESMGVFRLNGKECYASVVVKKDHRVTRHYRLESGQAREIDEIPLPKSYEEAQRARLDGHMAFPYSQLLGARPEVVFNRIRPDSDGKGELWWRKKGGKWQHAKLTGLQPRPWRLRDLKPLPDGRVFIATTEYEYHSLYNPQDNKFIRLGKSPMSTYRLECVGGKVYLMGYPGAYMVEYDPTKPWTYNEWSPDLADPQSPKPEPNPRECQRWSVGLAPVHHIWASAIGADGSIYIGAHAERVAVGGGLGWWDPVNRKAGVIREPYFLQQDIAGMCTAQDGKVIVYSSRPVSEPRTNQPVPSDAKLFVLNTTTKKIVGEITPQPGLKSCGSIAGSGDQVHGFAAAEKGVLYYVVDLSTGKTLSSRILSGVETAFFGPTAPDGRIYAVFNDRILARLKPTESTWELVGDVELCSSLVFVGNDLYFIGPPNETTLCRIQGLVKTK